MDKTCKITDQDTGDVYEVNEEEWTALVEKMTENDVSFGGTIKTEKEREIFEELYECKNFEELFLAVRNYLYKLDMCHLSDLIHVLEKFYDIYGYELIQSLKEVVYEHCFIYKDKNYKDKVSESDIQKDIIKNFNKLFPSYHFVSSEKNIGGLGRIDILAKDNESGRDVIIELKIDGKNPSQQLAAYGSAFDNPILIGINQEGIKESMRVDNITYYRYDYQNHVLINV